MNHAMWIGMAGVAWLAGCAHAEPSHSPSDRSVMVRKAHSRLARETAPQRQAAVINDEPTLFRICGVNVPGVYAEASPFDGGMGIVITTGDREQVDDLRKLAHAMSGTKATYHAGEPETDTKTEAPHVDLEEPYVEEDVEPPALNVIVTAENIDNGIMLIVSPREAKDAQVLAQRIREDVEELTSGNCPLGEQTIGAVTD